MAAGEGAAKEPKRRWKMNEMVGDWGALGPDGGVYVLRTWT